MTDTLMGVSPPPEPAGAGDAEDRTLSAAELAAVEDLVRRARQAGIALTGPDGLLKAMTKTVIEAALEEEMADHLGYDKHAVEGRNRANSRNGRRSKTVLTDSCGEVDIDVPRDREGTFEPQLVKKRQRRLGEVDEVVLSLYARGLTTGEISAHFADVYGASVSKDTVSRITNRVIEEMQAWWARPLEKIYAAIFIDAIVVKIRDSQVRNRPAYAAIGVDLDGHKDVLGRWAGDSDGESAKFWLAVLTELKNRGVADVFFVVCDGLKGLPASVNTAFPRALVQTCIIHLIRNTFRYASRKYWDKISFDLKPVYTAPTAGDARRAYEEFAEKWGRAYPAIKTLWDNAWEEFIPVPRLRRRDPQGPLQHERDREPQRPLPAGRPSPGSLPERAIRDEDPVLGDEEPGPQGHRADTMGRAVEASAERFRHHLRQPHAGSSGPLRCPPPLTPFIGQSLPSRHFPMTEADSRER